MPDRILAIDPGTTESAYVLFDGLPRQHGILENDSIFSVIDGLYQFPGETTLVVEKIESMGMAVGAETFETVWWSGRFDQHYAYQSDRLTRREVKLHLCGTMRAKDPNVRQALIDRFSGGKGEKAAKGTKAAPGPLYGISSHCWAALAVAVTYWDTKVKASATDQVLTTLTRKS